MNAPRGKLLPVLILLDALLTVVAAIFFDAPEANPLCAWLLSLGVSVFVAAKAAVATLAYVLLMPRSKWGRVISWAYVALVTWDLMVISYYAFGGQQ